MRAAPSRRIQHSRPSRSVRDAHRFARQSHQVDALPHFEALPMLHRRQRQQLVDHLRQPFALRADARGEARTVGFRHRRLRSNSALPRIAASGLFISCVSVCTYCSTYCLPSSRVRIVSSALAEVAELAGGLRRRRALARGHRVRVAPQRAELARQPPRRRQPDQQRDAHQQPAPAHHLRLAARDERRDASGWAWRR